MAYSLKNHEDRIATLESKIASSGGIVESSLTDPGYVKFGNGLIINFGTVKTDVTNRRVSWKKSFSSICLCALLSGFRHDFYQWYNDVSFQTSGSVSGGNVIPKFDKTGFNMWNEHNTGASFLAIGY